MTEPFKFKRPPFNVLMEPRLAYRTPPIPVEAFTPPVKGPCQRQERVTAERRIATRYAALSEQGAKTAPLPQISCITDYSTSQLQNQSNEM